MRTLRNAVEQGKVHHAYLFVGSRGTGKTSMAKILAACLNCENGPTIDAVRRRASRASSIASATSLDVIEMDAASNNSVDDIRDLRESVAYAPVSGRHKVYILDEAHMLSSQAWNAFLKTLEEPPPHTIFVLATTEAQKVLPTVVDRCHRFDFARPTVEQIAAVAARASPARSRSRSRPTRSRCSPATRPARSATRSARSSSSSPTAGTTIATEDVLAVLGVADADLLFGALDASPPATRAPRCSPPRGWPTTGRDLGRFLARPRGPRARAADRADARRGAGRAARSRPSATSASPSRPAASAAADVVRLLDLLAAALRR